MLILFMHFEITIYIYSYCTHRRLINIYLNNIFIYFIYLYYQLFLLSHNCTDTFIYYLLCAILGFPPFSLPRWPRPPWLKSPFCGPRTCRWTPCYSACCVLGSWRELFGWSTWPTFCHSAENDWKGQRDTPMDIAMTYHKNVFVDLYG